MSLLQVQKLTSTRPEDGILTYNLSDVAINVDYILKIQPVFINEKNCRMYYNGKSMTDVLQDQFKRLENYPEPTKLHNPQYTGKDSWDRQRIKRKADRWVNRLQQLPQLEREFILEKIKNL